MHLPTNADWIGWFIGLCAVFLAIVLYFKSKLVAELSYQWKGRHLVGGNEADLPAEVVIAYKGTNVPRLSSAEVILWNSGKSTVRGSDIVAADPLRIMLSQDAKILRISISAETRKVNAFSAKLHPQRLNEAICAFDFLDSGDGVRIELLHTSKEREPKILGTIRGLPSGVRAYGQVARPSVPFLESNNRTRRAFRKGIYKGMYITSIALGLAVALAGVVGPGVEAIYHSTFPRLPAPEMATSDRLLFMGIGLVYLLPGVIALWAIRRRFPRVLADDD